MKTCSVIIPLYNVEQYIEECLYSLLRQTYSTLQIIIIDDGSTDNSLTIAQQISATDNRIEIHRQQHQGLSAARNHGLKYAKGDYVCFLDSDDYLDNDFIATHISNISNNDIVQSGFKRVRNKQVVQTKKARHPYLFTSACARLYKADIVKNIKFPEGIIYEDVIFSLALWGQKPKIKTLDYCGYNYRLNPNSISSHRNHKAENLLYQLLWGANAPFWLKTYTFCRLKLHFMKQ